MKIFHFEAQAGRGLEFSRRIEQFGSTNALISGVARLSAEAQVSCMHIGPDGTVGYHAAVTPQLFLVVHGEGWVRGETMEQVPIRAGQAAFWQAGEGHASGSAGGMTAIVIEGSSIHLVHGSPP
jgi:hypothetical protein